jgi:hypothetical protein
MSCDKRLTIGDTYYLKNVASYALLNALCPRPKRGAISLSEGIELAKAQISAAEEFIFQAKRYLKEAKRK